MKKLIILSILAALTSCTAYNHEERINHIVFCWLKEPGNKVHLAQIVETSLQFKSIPGVLDVRAGEVIKSDRAIVDSSYDVAIILTFKNMDDLRAYIKHEKHVTAVKKILKPLTAKIRVYDFREKFKPYREN